MKDDRGVSRARMPGALRGHAPGPTLVAVGGIHGNEPAGLLAARRVLECFERRESALSRGDFVVLAGNLRALERGQRFVDRDLNREWTSERLDGFRDPDAEEAARITAEELPGRASEEMEMHELAQAFSRILGAARGPVAVLDLHTTSAAGVPFAVAGEEARSRELAGQFPVTRVLGLERYLHGVMVRYLESRGCAGLVVEAGPHVGEESVDRHEAVLWLALAATGLVRAEELSARESYAREAPGGGSPAREAPDLARMKALLEEARGDAPREIEVVSRHAIQPGDEFRMQPGFANTQRIQAGQLLATDRHGEIRAREDAVLLMPLYQPLGDDGFFLCRERVVAGT